MPGPQGFNHIDFTRDAQYGAGSGVTVNNVGAASHALVAGNATLLETGVDYDTGWIEFEFHNVSTSATLTDALINIYIGAAGSEVLLIDSLQVGWSSVAAATGLPIRYWFPLFLPEGTRLSAKLRALIAGTETVQVNWRYGPPVAGMWSGVGVETLGEVTASSRGTAVTPATAAPSWVTMGTSSRPYRYILMGVQGNNDTTAVDAWFNWQVGTGSAAYPGLTGWLTRIDSAEAVENDCRGQWCNIPESTALQLRAWASAAPSGLVYATLHGVY
jgi:hypothetical protein